MPTTAPESIEGTQGDSRVGAVQTRGAIPCARADVTKQSAPLTQLTEPACFGRIHQGCREAERRVVTRWVVFAHGLSMWAGRRTAGRDEMRRGSVRRWAAALVVAAVAVPAAGAARAETAAAAVTGQGYWTGSIEFTISETFLLNGDTWNFESSASYTNLAPSSNQPWVANDKLPYRAEADLTFASTWLRPCAPGFPVARNVIANWDFTGPSTAQTDARGNFMSFGEGAVAYLRDAPDGSTYFTPKKAVFNAPISSDCPLSQPGLSGYSSFSYQHDFILDAPTPLVDEDPNPDRLTGTTTYDLGTIPGGSQWDYTSYSFTTTYDLTRNSESNDADGDGVVDDDDACPGTPLGTVVDAAGCPPDSDGDGVTDPADVCPNTPQNWPVDPSGCPLDGDRDGVADAIDQCPTTPAGVAVEPDGCEPGRDSDLDRVPDRLDYCPFRRGSRNLDGCPGFIAVAGYAHLGWFPAFAGGDRSVLAGTDLSWIGSVCITSTWTATVKYPRSSFSMNWNTVVAQDLPFNPTIDRTLPESEINGIPQFPNGIFEETITFRRCQAGPAIGFPNIVSAAPATGNLVKLSHSQKTEIYRRDGKLIGTVDVPTKSAAAPWIGWGFQSRVRAFG